MLALLSIVVHAASARECNQDDFLHCIARFNSTLDFASRVTACARSTDVCLRYPFGMLTMMPSRNVTRQDDEVTVVGPAQVTNYPICLQGTPSPGVRKQEKIGTWCFPKNTSHSCDDLQFSLNPNAPFVPDGLEAMIRISGGAIPYNTFQPDNVTFSVNSSNIDESVPRARIEITKYSRADHSNAYFTLEQLAELRMALELKGDLYASSTAHPSVETPMCVTFAQLKWQGSTGQGSVEFQIWPYDTLFIKDPTGYHTNGSYRVRVLHYDDDSRSSKKWLSSATYSLKDYTLFRIHTDADGHVYLNGVMLTSTTGDPASQTIVIDGSVTQLYLKSGLYSQLNGTKDKNISQSLTFRRQSLTSVVPSF